MTDVVKRTGLIAIVVVLVSAGFLLGRSSVSQRPVQYHVQSLPVGTPEKLLADADEQFLAQPVAWLSEESRCFFSQPGVDAELNPFLRCGPIYRTIVMGTAPWETYAVSGSTEGGRFVLTLGERIETESGLDYGEILSRPDGMQPSDDQPSFPMGTPATVDVIAPTYPYDSWETALELEQCLAARGVRTFDVTASVSSPELVERIGFTIASFSGTKRYDVAISESGELESQLDSEDSDFDGAVDRCVRRAKGGYVDRVRLGQEHFPP